jgi:hypothetical protein
MYTPDHLLLDSAPIIGPLISRWELDKFKNCWNKSFGTSKILTLLYQQFLNLLFSQRDTSGPRLGALSNNRWSGDQLEVLLLNMIRTLPWSICNASDSLWIQLRWHKWLFVLRQSNARDSVAEILWKKKKIILTSDREPSFEQFLLLTQAMRNGHTYSTQV